MLWLLSCALALAPRTVDLVEQRIELRVAGPVVEGTTELRVVPLSTENRVAAFRAEGIDIQRVRIAGKEPVVEKTASGFRVAIGAGEQVITIDYRAVPRRGLLVGPTGFWTPPRQEPVADWVPVLDVERDEALYTIRAPGVIAPRQPVRTDALGHISVVAGAFAPVKGARVTVFVRAGREAEGQRIADEGSALVTRMEALTGRTVSDVELVLMDDGALLGSHAVQGNLVEDGGENLAHVLAHQWFGGIVRVPPDEEWLLEGFADALALMAQDSLDAREDFWKRGPSRGGKLVHAWRGSMGDAAFSSMMRLLLSEHPELDGAVVRRVRSEVTGGTQSAPGNAWVQISVENLAAGTILRVKQDPFVSAVRAAIRVKGARGEMVLPLVVESGETIVALPEEPEWAVLDEDLWVWPVPPMVDPAMTERALKSAALAKTRAAAARALRASKAFSTEEALIAAAKNDPDASVRADAVTSLAWFPSTATDSVIAAALNDPSARVQAAAAKQFCRRGDGPVARVLGKLAGTGSTLEVREAAAYALGCHEREVPDLVARAMKLRSPGGRVEAAIVRGVSTVRADHPIVLGALQGGSAREIEAAASTVVPTTQRAQVVQMLTQRVGDPNARVRLAAVKALVRLKAVEARPVLEHAARSEARDDVERAIAEALQ